MDYANTSYEDAKRQLVKTAAPDWLANLGNTLSEGATNIGENVQSSWANPEHAVAWNTGLGAAGGAGLGALSSAYQPKGRRNMLGRSLTGGLLGGIAGGAGTAIRDISSAATKDKLNSDDEQALANTLAGQEATGGGWMDRIQHAFGFGDGEGGGGGPADRKYEEMSPQYAALHASPGFGSVAEDIEDGSLQHHGVPEAAGLAATAASEYAGTQGHRGGMPWRSRAQRTFDQTVDDLKSSSTTKQQGMDLEARAALERLRLKQRPKTVGGRVQQFGTRMRQGDVYARTLKNKGLGATRKDAVIPGHDVDIEGAPLDAAGRAARNERFKSLKGGAAAQKARRGSQGKVGKGTRVAKSLGLGIVADLMARHGIDWSTGEHAKRLDAIRQAQQDNIAQIQADLQARNK